ncbi:unnamed protein product [Prorocentrum cordatum]|uniref:Uncharacterized protein n=1 Tax=Prorocentrum cordatum TaxID=2364126 RepID=A0ABN9YCE4_9DINO|nr:unnamed protein product [Polarella glacialis]
MVQAHAVCFLVFLDADGVSSNGHRLAFGRVCTTVLAYLQSGCPKTLPDAPRGPQGGTPGWSIIGSTEGGTPRWSIPPARGTAHRPQVWFASGRRTATKEVWGLVKISEDAQGTFIIVPLEDCHVVGLSKEFIDSLAERVSALVAKRR